jgi:Ni2+-binding GTPase involved in maturation of urease and hydrogenase
VIIPNEIIPRGEVQTILNDLTSADRKRGVIISGEAGIGKSNIILQIIQELQENSYPILIFRVDTLTATSSPKELGRQLELPESPACVLASIANGRECILVIDQLDAVSEISGRNPLNASRRYRCRKKIF